MATEFNLEEGEVAVLPRRKHDPRLTYVARGDEGSGAADILFVLTPGKGGLRLLPYKGTTFLGYEVVEEVPIFQLEDGSTTDWHEKKEEAPEEPPKEGQ